MYPSCYQDIVQLLEEWAIFVCACVYMRFLVWCLLLSLPQQFCRSEQWPLTPLQLIGLVFPLWLAGCPALHPAVTQPGPHSLQFPLLIPSISLSLHTSHIHLPHLPYCSSFLLPFIHLCLPFFLPSYSFFPPYKSSSMWLPLFLWCIFLLQQSISIFNHLSFTSFIMLSPCSCLAVLHPSYIFKTFIWLNLYGQPNITSICDCLAAHIKDKGH